MVADLHTTLTLLHPPRYDGAMGHRASECFSVVTKCLQHCRGLDLGFLSPRVAASY